MIKRSATAVWKGSGKEGIGHLTTASTVLETTPYSFNTRFAEGKGTNPEELIAAAHAGCFAMKLSFVLQEKGFTAEDLNVKATVSLNPDKGEVAASHLELTAHVPGISEADFKAAAEEAKQNCPVSKVLNAEISLEATLS